MKKEAIVCGVFLLFIAGFGALSIFSPVKGFSESENRFLAKKPAFNADDLYSGEFTEAYEKFITDQFPFRDGWIGIKVLVERAMLKQEINGVYFGKDDYLIEAHTGQTVNQTQLAENEAKLLGFTARLQEKLGAGHVRVMLVPTADSILTDKLPVFAQGFDQKEYLKSLERAMDGHGISEAFVNAADILDAHRDEDIYYRTDHHWTQTGAWYAYKKWIASIGIKPLEQSAFDIRQVTDQFYGTVYSKVHVNVKPDTIYLYEPLGNPEYRVVYNQGEETRSGLYQYDKLKTRDKYTVFMGGNFGLVQIEPVNHTADTQNRRLLVIKDSYANSFVPLLAGQFEKTEVIDPRYFNMSITEYMDHNSFTDVLILYNLPNFAEDKSFLLRDQR